MSALATLARLARREAEEIERQLAALEGRRRLLAQRIEAHDREIAKESALAQGSVNGAMTFGAFAQNALARRRLLIGEEAALAADGEALRETLREAFIELKKIETLIDQETARAAAEDKSREQAQMDDIATNIGRQKL